MHYPWWYVPHLTAPMLIALISVVRILVSYCGVGCMIARAAIDSAEPPALSCPQARAGSRGSYP